MTQRLHADVVEINEKQAFRGATRFGRAEV
jgi:hypothetical protein